MKHRDPFLNISPLDHRYWAANEELFEKLALSLSETAAVGYMVRAEASLLRIHVREFFKNNSEFLKAVNALESSITPEDVAAEEEITRHNIRALVNVIQRHLPPELAPFVHLGATSMDILDTSMAMRIRDAVRECVLSQLLELLDHLILLARREASTPQAGRTHGQLAVPITFGFAMAEYVSRLGQSIVEIEKRSGDLRGKLAGAVGAYNATGLISKDPEALEEAYLESLGLKRADYANQIVEPEHMLRLLLELNVAFGIIANLADDLRHLQRSEIAEVTESFEAGQVGSSTMPQKQNPWNSEHVKSLWKAFSPRVMTFYMDQISEHQRDLSNSASGRFMTDYIAGLCAAAARMTKVIQGISVAAGNMQSNLKGLGEGVLAEPAYILLALSGHADAHEIVRSAALEADSSGRSLKDILKEDRPQIWSTLSERMNRVPGGDAESFHANPASYSGLSEKRAVALAAKYADIADRVRIRLKTTKENDGDQGSP